MAEAVVKLGTMTIGEFDRFVEDAPEGVEYELVDGTPMLMGNPTQVHEQIVSNIVAPLHTAMKPKGCSAFAGNMRVQASDDSSSKNKFKPDVMVRCGPIIPSNYVTDPIVIVEVLSPSTMDRDRGVKLEFYKELASVQHIVFAYSDSPRIEHYVRTDTAWERKVLLAPEDKLELGAVGFEMDLDEIYSDIPFEKAPRLWTEARGTKRTL
jgi:Uma2 family endonuclease